MPFLNKPLPKNKFTIKNKQVFFRKQDYLIISHLLDSGIDFKRSLQFFDTKYQAVISALNQGSSIQDILSKQKDGISKNIVFFLHYSSMKDAIEHAFALVRIQEQLKKQIVSKFAYPLVIVIVCIALLQLFYHDIFPMLMTSFPTMSNQMYIVWLVQVFYIFATIIKYSLILLSLVLVVAHLSVKIQYSLIHHTVAFVPILKQYCSYIFGQYMLILNQAGISTMDGLQYLVKLDCLWLSNFSLSILEQLEQGTDFLTIMHQSPYITNTLYQALQLRFHTQENHKPLEVYLVQQEELWKLEIKKLTLIVYAITYTLVALIVFIMFQFMLIPFDLLSTMG